MLGEPLKHIKRVNKRRIRANGSEEGLKEQEEG